MEEVAAVRSGWWGIAFLLLVGCGDDAPATPTIDAFVPCTWTVDGGAGTAEKGGTCTFEAHTTSPGVTVTLTNNGDLHFNALLALPSGLAADVYTTSDNDRGGWAPHTGFEVPYGFSMCAGSGCGGSDTAHGSFKLTIDDPGPETDGTWTSVVGTLYLSLDGYAGATNYRAYVTATFR